jgi:hypothetical protein
MSMKARCLNPVRESYANYGARGITVCEAWATSFEAFLADMGPRPGPGMSIDRIDNDRGYEPGNCRWATATEQAENRRSTKFIEFDGRRLSQAAWARELGITSQSLSARLKKWGVVRALTEGRHGV